jgi:glucuronate isomerase
LFVTPDHYAFRMIHSQGVPLEAMGVPRVDGGPTETDGRKIWRILAENYYLFRGTPTQGWLDHVFQEVFGFDVPLSAETADVYYDHHFEKLRTPAFRPRALFERFNIEVIATTESPLDDLKWHRMIRDSGWQGRVITAYRPDAVTDPDFAGFTDNVAAFCALAGVPGTTWRDYLDAHRARRAYFKEMGATSTDHGHVLGRRPRTFRRRKPRHCSIAGPDRARAMRNDARAFRAQMLTEMAKMSVEDGMVMQIHPGSFRNHNSAVFHAFGRDRGFDIPTHTDYVHALRPLLGAVGDGARP